MTEFLKLANDVFKEQVVCRWPGYARTHQMPDLSDWTNWLLLGGRGAGKTRAGAEWVRTQVEGSRPMDEGLCRQIALVGETYDQVRDIMVFGVSGRVIQAINGPAAFSVGVNVAKQRFDLGIGGFLNSSFVGLDTKARTYFADTPLIIESQDADFIDGVIRLCIHKVTFQPPAAV